jgi:hypothetical protein
VLVSGNLFLPCIQTPSFVYVLVRVRVAEASCLLRHWKTEWKEPALSPLGLMDKASDF